MGSMKNGAGPRRNPIYLGIEAGGTRTVALAAELNSSRVLRKELGPANLRLLDDARLLGHFRAVAKSLPRPDALAIGMAGARTDADRKRIRDAAARTWPGVPCYATNDLETALMAADAPAGRTSQPTIRVLVLSGTGSCCFGRADDGQTAKVGGWGHILGDKGSGFEIGLRALKAVVYYFDRDAEWSGLGRRILRVLQLNEPNDLIGWVQSASKTSIAALAVEVFNAWTAGDRIAADILEGAAESLARDAASCAARLAKPGTPVQFVFAGSVLLKQPRFTRRVGREIQRRWKKAVLSPLTRESAYGAIELAQREYPPESLQTPLSRRASSTLGVGETHPPAKRADARELFRGDLPPTEQRNPRSMNLDRMSLHAAIGMMLREDAKLPAALLAERPLIERSVKLIVRSFKTGGRLFYVGAGTSGRLGILDASECPPTFRTDPELVQGIIAGGQTAIWQAVEGAEDDSGAGAQAIAFRGVGRRDTVVGIAASGRTPFVWGALREAKRRGASTILLCFNPNLVVQRSDRPTLIIAPKIGPEILTGSTRLKSGTATKLVLNIFTTLAMVRMGKVLGNLMVDVKASNVKLRDRAVRIVRELTGADYAKAEAALKRTDWKIKEACARLGRR